MSKQDDYFNANSIFGGQEKWRFDEGYSKGYASEGQEVHPFSHRDKSDKWKEGYQAGVEAYKRDRMERLLTGKATDEEVEDMDLDNIFGRKKNTGIITKP